MQRQYKVMALTAAAAAVVVAGAALADDGWHGRMMGGRGMMGGPMQMFETFDTNKDGKVTEAEIVAVRDGRFDQFDADKDGRLTLEEYQALWLDAMRRNMVRQFQRHDDDGDAAVTKEEFNERFTMMIERFDDNNDGAIERDEIRPQRGPRWRDGGGPGPNRDDDDDSR
jgi:Ca2+-binding EF-hand superfamily protein